MRGPDARRTERARNLRKTDNGAEAKLWHALRNRQLNGRKFVRQMPIGPYFADFACREFSLVVEIDGSQHIDDHNDQVRNLHMNRLGWSVARFSAGDVIGHRGDVLETISAICDGRIVEPVRSPEFNYYPMWKASHPGPLPVNGERGQDSDTLFMNHALRLGMAQMGRTFPNPSVGCVLVKDGQVIGEGATGDGGRPHAEEIALDAAGAAALGATAYVTLEPCAQRSNGGCSCSERLVQAGVARVVYACDDPSPYASHAGVVRMKAAGIVVESGLVPHASVLIEGFVHFLKTGRPMVRESDDGQGLDAVFEPDGSLDLPDDLANWGARGYRSLAVPRGSELAQRLRQAGYLTE